MNSYKSVKPTTKIFLILLVFLIVISLSAFFYYQTEKNNLIKQNSYRLQSIALFNEKQIVYWYNERLSDAEFLLHDNFIKNYLIKLSNTFNADDSLELAKVIYPMFKNHDYRTIIILDKNLKTVINYNQKFNPDSNEISNVKKTFKLKAFGKSEINKNKISNEIYFDLYIPIIENNDVISVIILSIDPNRLLYTFIDRKHFGLESIKSILFRKEDSLIINLSPARLDNLAPLDLKIPIKENDWTSYFKTNKTSQEQILTDYRNEKVLGDIRKVRNTNWYLLTKIDSSEIFGAIYFKIIASAVIVFLLAGIIVFLIDYFNQKFKLEQLNQIRDSEIKYKQIIELALEGIIIFDESLKIIHVNSVICRDLNYSPEELLKKKIPSIFDPSDLNKHPFKIKELIAGENVINERYLLKKDGGIFLADTSAKMLPDKTFFLVARDITQKHKIMEQIKNSERKFRSLFEFSNDAIFLMDDINFIDCNPKAERLFDTTKTEIVNKTPLDFSTEFQPDGVSSQVSVVKRINKVYKGKPQLFEWLHVAGGKEIYCEVNLSLTEIDNKPILISLVRDISERKRFEKELIAAKERAEEMNLLKSNFLANMSHELRTPLVAILGFTQILTDEIKNEEQVEMLQSIYKGGKRLLETLNSILELTQIESKEHVISKAPVKLNELLKSEIALFNPEAFSKKLNLKAELPDDEVIIFTDERLLKIILRNLLTNSIKFTDNGSVILSLKRKNFMGIDSIVISIKDTGIGILNEHKELIFQEFRQSSEGFNRKYEGSGLGLTIAKKFVAILNGEIEFESQVGVGTEFIIILPVNYQSEFIEAKDTSVKKIINKKYSSQNERQNMSLPKLLIVEDDINTITLINIYLRNMAIIDIAGSSKAALEKAEHNDYHLILMDINLGEEIDGLMLTKILREMKKYESVPIIAVTAFAMETDRANAIEAGCSNYISKPFDKAALIKMIKEELSLSAFPR